MRYRLLWIVGAALFVASCRPAAEENKTSSAPQTSTDQQASTPQQDLSAIQGTWEIVSAQSSGVDATKASQARSPRITFQGDGWLQDIDGHVIYTAKNSHIRLDPSKSPKEFDHVLTSAVNGKPATLVYPGIYELDGDTLKLCWDVGLKQRPTKFESTTGDNFFVATLKRVPSSP